jgi:NDP-sugar pyrophosphorylase family protein
MKAMILAAGLGTRLKPLTDNKPKALIEIGGVPLLEHVIIKLKKFGIREIIINTHHFADQIEKFLRAKNHFEIHIELSYEKELLDTGGGLKRAGWFFDDRQPFLLYNTDVLSNIDLNVMRKTHLTAQALATLAVRQRDTSRYFLFDEQEKLVGWESKASGERKLTAIPDGKTTSLSFMGIHLISPRIFNLFKETGAFSIVEAYLRLAGEGQMIKAFRADAYSWLDLGRIENIAKAEKIRSFELNS